METGTGDGKGTGTGKGRERRIASVEVADIAAALHPAADSELLRRFAPEEIDAAGQATDRIAYLAARLAAKRACLELYAADAAAGRLEPTDIIIENDGYGAPYLVDTPALRAVRGTATIGVSLTHTGSSAAAVVWRDIFQSSRHFGKVREGQHQGEGRISGPRK